MKVEFYKHNVGEEELKGIEHVISTPFLTSGPKTTEFENQLAGYLKVPHCLGVNSCTAGLFLSLKALGIGPGDEVIVPAMTFIATANVVLHCNAKPVIVDVEANTGLIDPEAVRDAITDKTKAIIPVHLYGQLADMKELKKIADEHRLKLVEDAAHAVEARRDGYRTGELGDVAAFSFYATKNITCGEGGAISLHNPDLLEKLKVLRLHGMSKSAADRYNNAYKHWDMVELGWKFNLNDLQSAMLIPQLQKIDQLRDRREDISRHYESRFSAEGVEFPEVVAGSTSARHLFTIWSPAGKRDEMLARLQKENIGVAVNYRAIHLLSYYKEHFGFQPGIFPNAENIGDRTISIPLYPKLTQKEVEYVTEKVIDIHRDLS